MLGAMDDLGPPSSYLALAEGAPVYSSDGSEVGRVAEVRDAPAQDIFDGLVVEMATGGRRLVAAADVDEVFERGVVLKIDAAAFG
jgi:hypothetical protein